MSFKENRVKALRQLFGRSGRGVSSFDRYYGGVVRPGAGYPTADEARRDLRHSYHRGANPLVWTR